ncbi:virB8 family protein [Epibacterium ulvae]|uniref:virB8 family protein n=1 Tax=Epibacterium ulvae TaxID=1156985 RepID=UPI002492090B|nr:type IV secretion system protein [Epibacterium ulvae]
MVSEVEIIEEELVYGARRRELMWQKLGLSGLGFGVIGCLVAAGVAILDVDPPPMIVPFDVETGMALPNAIVQAVSLTERPAIIEAQIYRYVINRETYNQLDNDIRVRTVLDQSDGAAANGLRALWTSGHEAYPPDSYGTEARLEVEVLSITHISSNRAQVRLRKQLNTPRGNQNGLFTATLMFEFRPENSRSIDDVWQNPFGFTVTEYAIRSDRLE